MVLIIRNNRIQSRRHSRISNFLSYVVPKSKKKLVTEKEKESTFIMTDTVKVLGVFFIYSIAMFTLPFVAFYYARHIMETEFQTDRFVTNCVSVTAAVIVVNFIIGIYVYQALHEPEEPSESFKSSDSSDTTKDTNKKVD